MRGEKRERILRVLLAEKLALSKNELAKRTCCSRQWVILFLKELEKKKCVKGTKVIHPKKLFAYWLQIHKKPKKYREYMVRDPLELLKHTDLDYALTTYQAENLVQRYLFPSRVDIYINGEDLAAWHSLFTKKGLYGKGNVRVIPVEEHIFYKSKKLQDLFVVCLPQLIIDLLSEGGPCVEAGEMLLEVFSHV